MWLLPLETKETLKSGKTQMQVGHVNSFGPGHIEDGLLLQFREKKQEETSNTSVAVHLEKRRNNFLYRSDNNAKMRSFLRQSAFNCAKCTLHKDICTIVNIQLSFKTFINVLRNSKILKATFICAYCKFNNIKRIFFHVIGHSF